MALVMSEGIVNELHAIARNALPYNHYMADAIVDDNIDRVTRSSEPGDDAAGGDLQLRIRILLECGQYIDLMRRHLVKTKKAHYSAIFFYLKYIFGTTTARDIARKAFTEMGQTFFDYSDEKHTERMLKRIVINLCYEKRGEVSPQ